MQYDDRGRQHGANGDDQINAAQQEELDRIEALLRVALDEDGLRQASPIPMTLLDRKAIENERVFIRRFGFDWPRRDRIAVIELKRRLDLTDREIRLLKWTGNRKQKHGVVRLASTRWSAIFGRSLIIAAGIEFAGLMLLEAVTTHHALSGLQVAKLYGTTAFVLAMLWMVHFGYVKPWIIERRVRA